MAAKGRKKNTGTKKMATAKRNRMEKILWLIPVLLWMTLIFYMSQGTGSESGSVSMKFTEKFASLINMIRGDGMQVQDNMVDFLHPIIRKLAHMFEYAVLLLLMIPAVRAWNNSGKKSYIYILSFILTFIYACTDEIHQLFIDGRAGKTTDVLIDSAGALIAVIMAVATGSSKWRVIAWFLFAIAIVACFLFLIFYGF